MADAQASGACGRKIVWVQVPSPAFFYFLRKITGWEKACIYNVFGQLRIIEILQHIKKYAPFLPLIF